MQLRSTETLSRLHCSRDLVFQIYANYSRTLHASGSSERWLSTAQRVAHMQWSQQEHTMRDTQRHRIIHICPHPTTHQQIFLAVNLMPHFRLPWSFHNLSFNLFLISTFSNHPVLIGTPDQPVIKPCKYNLLVPLHLSHHCMPDFDIVWYEHHRVAHWCMMWHNSQRLPALQLRCSPCSPDNVSWCKCSWLADTHSKLTHHSQSSSCCDAVAGVWLHLWYLLGEPSVCPLCVSMFHCSYGAQLGMNIDFFNWPSLPPGLTPKNANKIHIVNICPST